MAQVRKAPPMVTRESIAQMLQNPNRAYVEQVIGRALVSLFNRQTEAEKGRNDAEVDNMEGFSGQDARSGSLTAKYFLKNKKLEDWQIANWTRVGSTGFPRLCKYHRQLNEIAVAKREAELQQAAEQSAMIKDGEKP
jgi:hypothetical protein